MKTMSSSTQAQDSIVVLSKPFYKILCDFYQSSDDFYMTRNQVGEALEYSNPQKALSDIHTRNADRINQFSVIRKLRSTDGKAYDTVVYSLRGVMEICRFSRQPKADEFMDFVWDVMETLFRGEAVLTPTNSNQLSELLIEQSLEIGSLKDRLSFIEDAVKKEFQIQTREIVRLDGRYYQLKQENKAIRTDLSLLRKELHPEAYTKPSKQLPTKPEDVKFQNVECLFNDMKDQYQSFITSESAIYRIVEINNRNLHFEVNKCNKASMDVLNVTKGEKKIVDGRGVAEYKVYFEGCAEPIIFTAIPKRL